MSIVTTKKHSITLGMRHELKARGWTVLPRVRREEAGADAICLGLAKELGTPIASRGPGLVDILVPQVTGLAKPRSLSAQTGTGTQPWHVDLSHHAEPARYVVLYCLCEGQVQAPTELLDRHKFLSPRNQIDALSEPFLVRSGRHSFYATIIERSKPFIRFDPGCMQGATARAKELMMRLLIEAPPPSYAHHWTAGDSLLVDNWRLLHRRTDAGDSLDRTLLRVSVMKGK